MISYEPFWKTLKAKHISTYTLVTTHKISNGTLTRMRRNDFVSLKTVNDFCRILDCQIQDIAKYIPSDHDQPL